MVMLFLRDEEGGQPPRAVYLLGDEFEQMLEKGIDRRMSEHGYPLNDSTALTKDMHFLRCKRQLSEQISRQSWLLFVRGIMIGLGALLILGLKEYMTWKVH